jgi:hypothetical protein
LAVDYVVHVFGIAIFVSASVRICLVKLAACTENASIRWTPSNITLLQQNEPFYAGI